MKRVLFSGFAMSVIGVLCLPIVASASVVPVASRAESVDYISVSAIPAADERNFADPVTRCLTPEIKSMNKKALEQMNEEVQKYPGATRAIEGYKENMEILWDAMNEPYCGYGGYGLTAVKHSFLKSVAHIRAEFLAEVAAR